MDSIYFDYWDKKKTHKASISVLSQKMKKKSKLYHIK